MDTENINLLVSQSNFRYQYLKDEETKLYYIRRVKDMKTVLVGDREDALNFTLYGLSEMAEDVQALFTKSKKDKK